MKMRLSLIAGAVFGLCQLTHAQCPEICDGNANTALGQSALVNNVIGMNNTAVGFQALQNSNADGNTATGYQALKNNGSGTFNTAYGQQALAANTSASSNTAFGAFTLALNVFGANNTAVGYEALAHSTAANNTALGWEALGGATTGQFNTAVGSGSLSTDTTGSSNTSVGVSALTRNSNGSNNIAIGSSAGSLLTTGSNNIDIGNPGVAGERNTIRIGDRTFQQNTYVAGISGRTIAGGVGVLVDVQGHLGTNTSSARYKEQIKPMDKASEAILSLRPVTFRYKHELDPDGIPQFGLVAEQVEKVNPALVARDEAGKPYTVRYEAVNAMLLNEFIKEHRKVESLAAAIAKQQKSFQSQIAALTAALEAQAAQIREVSNHLRTKAVAPRVAVND